MSGSVLAGLDYSPAEANDNNSRNIGLDEDRMLEFLRINPALATELLSYEGNILYMGSAANGFDEDGRSLGVTLVDGGTAIKGDNAYGEFLMEVRDLYRRELAEESREEVRVKPDQIVFDYVPVGEAASDIEMREQEGETFIHTDVYRPVRFRFDAARDGSTGYNRRESDNDVPFMTFECPFGLTSRSKIKVDSAVEVSLYYEKALRGDLDWKNLFAELKKRGNISKMPKAQEEQLLKDLVAQFKWMREEICRNNDVLSERPIVSESNLIPDSSFGRSVYDQDTAPSPAHILARYINNPDLFYSHSENGVARALDINEKNEAYRFSAVSGQGEVYILIDGSDTIGGRQPGTRAVSERQNIYQRNEDGSFAQDRFGEKVVQSTKKVSKMQFKPQEEIESDYVVFSQRLANIVANISPEVKINFITSKGVGVPQMVKRFVQENGGRVYDWDYEKKEPVADRKGEREGAEINARFSQTRMSNFRNVYPVLVHKVNSTTFLLDEADADSEVSFSVGDGLNAKGVVSFSTVKDSYNRSILERGSLACEAGLPLIHVLENRSESEQQIILAAECSKSRSLISGEEIFSESLFTGKKKNSWLVDGKGNLSYIKEDGSIALPYVSFSHDVPVYVSGVPFKTVFGAFTALAARESGADNVALQSISAAEGSMASLVSAYSKNVDAKLGDDVIERCMRNSVHMMAQSSSSFANMLLNSGDDTIVMPSTFEVGKLFTDITGHGENRFGVVFQAEREVLRSELQKALDREAEEEKRMFSERELRHKMNKTRRARGEKMTGGLPASIAEGQDAVWFLGTARPAHLSRDVDSLVHWVEFPNGVDALNREIASRSMLDDGQGGKIENNLVFLFPSDLQAVQGRRHVMNSPDSKNLTGVVRRDPKTGKEFVCAFGIPVKKDDSYFEYGNKLGRACSFMLDNDNFTLRNSLIEADALARSTALTHDMCLCYAKRDKRRTDGDVNDDLSRVFVDKVWGYERTKEKIDRNTGKVVQEGDVILPKEVTETVYNAAKMSYEKVTKKVIEKGWVPNPHASKLNLGLIKKYEDILVQGVEFPLNYFCMPKTDYSDLSAENAEEKFRADFALTLDLMNATAISLGLPMRFPLDENGRLDLGPDVPERLRDFAESKLDSFINAVSNKNIINDSLPFLQRVPIHSVFSSGQPLKTDGSDLYLHPKDLVQAFGTYDFTQVKNGMKVPVHEMAFVDDEGTKFKVTGTRLTTSLQLGEINRYVRYDKNDEVRFRVLSSDPEKIPDFILGLKSYVERAKRVKVEYKLVTEKEVAGQNYGMDGFVSLLSSNSDQIADESHIVAARGVATSVEIKNRFDGTDNEQEYYGKEDAKDAFAGYAMCRCTLPDGSQTPWEVIKDREVALDVIYTKVSRKYNADIREVPSESIVEAEVRSYCIQSNDEKFRHLQTEPVAVQEDTKVVVSERKAPVEKTVATTGVKKMNIYAGTGENPELSNFAVRPFRYDVSKIKKQVKF